MSELRDDDLQRELTALSRELDSFRVGPPPRALVEATLRHATRELRAQLASRRLPVGFRRELAKLAIVAAPPLVMVLAWNAFLLPRLARVLSEWLPAPLAASLAFAYAAGALAWLGLTAGLLPIAAHQRARLRAREA
jgi:hypothetical protein